MSSHKAQQQGYKPSHHILQGLNRLKRSSPDFADQLTSLLPRNEYEYLTFLDNFHEEDEAWFFDYLENVRVCVSLYLLSTEPVQVLDDLEYDGPAHRRCRVGLQKICRDRAILPLSYKLFVSSFTPTPDPNHVGGPYEIICEGWLNGSKVYVKKVHPFPKLSGSTHFTKVIINVVIVLLTSPIHYWSNSE